MQIQKLEKIRALLNLIKASRKVYEMNGRSQYTFSKEKFQNEWDIIIHVFALYATHLDHTRHAKIHLNFNNAEVNEYIQMILPELMSSIQPIRRRRSTVEPVYLPIPAQFNITSTSTQPRCVSNSSSLFFNAPENSELLQTTPKPKLNPFAKPYNPSS